MFISFEGIEGCGKSTLMNGLADALRAMDVPVVTTREPGGTDVGDRIRAIFLDFPGRIEPFAEALLINASRTHLVSHVIEPALEEGMTVLCDRFTDSTLAYQGYGRGLALEMLEPLCDAATLGLHPDLTFIIDIPVELSRRRVAERTGTVAKNADRMESEDDAFYERVRQGYLEIANVDPDRIRLLDGTVAASALLLDALQQLMEVAE
ncbi:MAG: dTMP kinase [Candidatus Eremiobacteraeota bacterium]|nr:dTMP kinase [Candidatus Eremiobacteraeota bacterium]